MTVNPLVSVIITSYNQMHFLYEAIDSVVCQGYQNIELIITDDGTDDFISEDVENYIDSCNKGNITNINILKNDVNVGTVKNLNGALPVANGKYIMMLDGDDLYADDCISFAVEFMEAHSEYHIAAGHVQAFNNGDDIHKIRVVKDAKLELKLGMNPRDRYIHMCKKGDLCTSISAHVFTRQFFTDEGLFDERYRLYQDRPMLLRVARQGYCVGYIDHVILLYRNNVGVSSGGNLQLLYDGKTLVECEYNPNISILGKSFCRKIGRYYDCIISLRTELVTWSWRRRVFFGIKYADVFLFQILPTFGVSGLLQRFRKHIKMQ